MTSHDIHNAIVHCKQPINVHWDAFVHHSRGDIQQTSVWTAVDGDPARQVSRFYLMEGGDIVAGDQVVTRRMPVVGRFGFILQGPCFKEHSFDYYDWFVAEAMKVAAKEGLRYLAVVPDYKVEGLVSLLEKRGFRRKSVHLPPNPTVKSTLILDLRQSLEVLMQQVKKKRRKCILKGLACPVTYSIGGRDDLETFYTLLLATCKRRNAKPILRSSDILYRLWDRLAHKDAMVLHLAHVDGRPVGASIGLVNGGTYKNWLWGWTGEYSNYCISETLDWKTIEWAKAHGCCCYDFLHLDPVSAKALEADEEVPDLIRNRTHFGSTFYKMQFGGEVVHYPDIYYYFPRKRDYWLFHVLGHTLLNLCVVKKLALMFHPYRRAGLLIPLVSWSGLELLVV